MSQKLSTLEDSERKDIEKEVSSVSSGLGLDAYESYGSTPEQKKLKELIGMCCDCRNLNYCATEFGNVCAICSAFEFKLSGQNRIVECNLHSPKNVMTLSEMFTIATLIDAEKENKVGFTANVKSKRIDRKEEG